MADKQYRGAQPKKLSKSQVTARNASSSSSKSEPVTKVLPPVPVEDQQRRGARRKIRSPKVYRHATRTSSSFPNPKTTCFKEKLKEILVYTGYPGDINDVDNMDFEENAFTEWFVQNITIENCVTLEEVTKFEELKKTGKMLIRDDIEEVLDKHGVDTTNIHVDKTLLEIKKDELDHAQHTLELEKQLLSSLNIELKYLNKDCMELDEKYKAVKADFSSALEGVVTTNIKFCQKLDEVKETFTNLFGDLTDLKSRFDQSTDVPNSSECEASVMNSSILSLNTSFGSTISTTSAADVSKSQDFRYMFETPLKKYHKIRGNLLKLIKKILQNEVTKLNEETTPHAKELVFGINDRLADLKAEQIKLEAELAFAARDEIRKLSKELEDGVWVPTEELLNDKLEELDSSMISDNSFSSTASVEEELEERLMKACNRWADIQVMPCSAAKLDDNIEIGEVVIKQLKEIVSIINSLMILDLRLQEVMQLDLERVQGSITLYRKVRSWLSTELDEVSKLVNEMEENIQDYNAYKENSYGEVMECLGTVLGCEKSNITEALNNLADLSSQKHQMRVQSLRQQLHTLNSVHNDLKKLVSEEFAKIRQTTGPGEARVSSIKEMVGEIAWGIDEAKIICDQILEKRHEIRKPN